MKEFPKIVLIEKSDLDINRGKLLALITSKEDGERSDQEMAILNKQLRIMIEYSNVLEERIIQFHD